MDPLLNPRPAPGGSRLAWGVAQSAMPGETQSGDECMVLNLPGGCLIAVADGLGHGDEAARAAQSAMQVLRQGPHTSVIQQVRKCHEALRPTRGVVLSLALLNYAEETVAWLGVGNVGGVLLRASAAPGEPGKEYLLCRGGVVGAQLPALHAGVMPMAAGDTLMFYTDGVEARSAAEFNDSAAEPQRAAEALLRNWAKGSDDALVLVARYLGGRQP